MGKPEVSATISCQEQPCSKTCRQQTEYLADRDCLLHRARRTAHRQAGRQARSSPATLSTLLAPLSRRRPSAAALTSRQPASTSRRPTPPHSRPKTCSTTRSAGGLPDLADRLIGRLPWHNASFGKEIELRPIWLMPYLACCHFWAWDSCDPQCRSSNWPLRWNRICGCILAGTVRTADWCPACLKCSESDCGCANEEQLDQVGRCRPASGSAPLCRLIARIDCSTDMPFIAEGSGIHF